jgi:hypothetical protein
MKMSLLAGLGLSLFVSGASAQTLVFQQGLGGYAGTQDTMVRSNETASPGDSRDINYGAELFVSVDGDDGSPGVKPNHGLIRFDQLFGTMPGQIQPGDTITGATLRVYVDNPGSGMSVHDMLAPWSQGSVTWNSLVGGVQTDGVEAAAAPIASFGANTSAENVPRGWLSIDVSASLLAAQSGALPGFGWALLPFVAGTNGIDFHSGEYALDAALRPELSVAIVPLPEPATWLLMALGAAGLAARRLRA